MTKIRWKFQEVSRMIMKSSWPTGNHSPDCDFPIYRPLFLNPGSKLLTAVLLGRAQGGLENGATGGALSREMLNPVFAAGDHLHFGAEFLKTLQHLNNTFCQV